MARIRSIKPELPQDAKLARVSRNARLTFLYLLTQVDDAGYFRASTRILVGQLYPHDADVTEAMLEQWLEELVGIGRVKLFDSEDGAIGQIVNFLKHQRIDHPTKSYLASLSRTIREPLSSRVLSPESRVLSPEQNNSVSKETDDESSQEVFTQGEAMGVLRASGFFCDNTDGSITKALLGKGVDRDAFERMAGGLRLLCDRGEFRHMADPVMPGKALSMKLVYSANRADGQLPLWRKAELAYDESQKKRGKASEPTRLNVLGLA